jgi:hypothetical protein
MDRSVFMSSVSGLDFKVMSIGAGLCSFPFWQSVCRLLPLPWTERECRLPIGVQIIAAPGERGFGPAGRAAA